MKLMKQFCLFMSLLLITPFLASAQSKKISPNFKTSVGTPYEVVDAGSKEYFALEDGNCLSVKTRGEEVTIQKFDTRSMKEIGRKEYKDFPKYTKVQRVLQIRGKIFFVYESYDKKTKNFTLHCREVNTAQGTFESPKELLVTEGPITALPFSWDGIVGGWGIFALGSLPKFDISTSFDDSKILVQFRYAPAEKKDAKNNDKIGFFVFDQDFKKIWGANVVMPYTEKDMNNLAYTVQSNGTACMLIHNNTNKSLELLTIREGGVLKVNKLDVRKELIFAKFNLLENPDGNIVAAGFYANGIDFKWSWGSTSTSFNCNGLYYFTMTEDGEILKAYDYEFPLEFIQQYLSKREANKAEKREEKGKAGMEDVKMSKFFIQADGSCIFIAEQWYSREEMVGTSTQRVWHYRHMIMIKVDAEGKLLWMRKLPKNQAGLAGQGQMSFQYVPGEGHHYLLYVDNPKNIDLEINEVPDDHKDGMGGYITTYKINDETGNIDKHTILQLDKIDGKSMTAYQFNVKRIFQAMDKVFMLEVYIKGKKDVMVKMELKD